MASKPVGWFFLFLFVICFVGEVEDLDFDALWEGGFVAAVLHRLDHGGDGPDENARVASGFVVTPFSDHFEIGEGLFGGDDADWSSDAGDGVSVPCEGFLGAVDFHEIISG